MFLFCSYFLRYLSLNVLISMVLTQQIECTSLAKNSPNQTGNGRRSRGWKRSSAQDQQIHGAAFLEPHCHTQRRHIQIGVGILFCTIVYFASNAR